jgi:hypothetical protein
LVVVGFRAGNIVVTSFILYAVFGGGQHTIAAKYKQCFDREHFLELIYPYAALCFIACLECQLCFLLPWKYSEFSLLAKGFPDMLSLRATSYYKIVQDAARFTCNILYLLKARDEAAEASVEVMTYFNLLASIASIVLASMVAIMKNSILKEVEAAKGTTPDTEEGGIELGGSTGGPGERDGSTVEYTNNPLLHPGAEEGLLLRDVQDKTSVRNFLIRLLPEIDASSLHAVDSAFRHDGVVTVGELTQYLAGGVLSLSDLKSYSKAGKLTMSHTLTLTKAVELLLIRRSVATASTTTTTNTNTTTSSSAADYLSTPDSTTLSGPMAVTSPLQTRRSSGLSLASIRQNKRRNEGEPPPASPAASALLDIAASLEALTSQVKAKAGESVGQSVSSGADLPAESGGDDVGDKRRESLVTPLQITPKRLSTMMTSILDKPSSRGDAPLGNTTQQRGKHDDDHTFRSPVVEEEVGPEVGRDHL